jgi:hypothetical protein
MRRVALYMLASFWTTMCIITLMLASVVCHKMAKNLDQPPVDEYVVPSPSSQLMGRPCVQ